MKRKPALATPLATIIGSLLAIANLGGCIQPNADPTIPENRSSGTFFHPNTVGTTPPAETKT